MKIARVFSIFVLATVLAGTSQAGVLALSGNFTLIGTAGSPPGFVPGTYDFVSNITFTPSVTNVATITAADLTVQTTSGLGPYAAPAGGTITLLDGPVNDQVTVNLQVTPLSNLVFTFVNSSNPVSSFVANDANILETVLWSVGTPSGTLNTSISPPTISAGSVKLAPEPSSFALLAALSVGGAGWYRRRKAATA